MREILFKAKSENIDGTFDWIEGYLSKCDGKWTICDDEGTGCFVEEETICQYTGLTDKNGNKIWENDIVAFEDTGEDGYEYKEGFDFQNRAKIVFRKGRWELSDFLSDNSYIFENMNNHEELFALWDYVEVTGNTFDNEEVGCE